MKTKIFLYLSVILMMLTATVTVAQRGTCTTTGTLSDQYYRINGTQTHDYGSSTSNATVPTVPVGATVQIGMRNNGTELDNGPVSTFTIDIYKNGTFVSQIVKGVGSYGNGWQPTIPAANFTAGAQVVCVMTVTPGSTFNGCSVGNPWTYTYTFNTSNTCTANSTTFYYNNNISSGWVDPISFTSNNINIPGSFSLGSGTSIYVGVHLGSGCSVAYSDGLGWTASGSGDKRYFPNFAYNAAGPETRTITATITDNCGGTSTRTFKLTSANTCTPSTPVFYYNNQMGSNWVDPATPDSNRNITVPGLLSPGASTFIYAGIRTNGGSVVWTDDAGTGYTATTTGDVKYYPNLESGATRVLTATYTNTCGGVVVYTYTMTAATVCIPATYTPYYNNGGWHNAADASPISFNAEMGTTLRFGINPGNKTATWTDGGSLNQTSAGEFAYNPGFTAAGQTRTVTATLTDNCGNTRTYDYIVTSTCTSVTPVPYYNNGLGWTNKTAADTTIDLDIEVGVTASFGVNPSNGYNWTGDAGTRNNSGQFSYVPTFTGVGQTKTLEASKTDSCGNTTTFTFNLHSVCISPTPIPHYNIGAGVVNLATTAATTDLTLAVGQSVDLSITPNPGAGSVVWSTGGTAIATGTNITFNPKLGAGQSKTVTGVYTDKCGISTTYTFNLSTAANTFASIPTTVCKGATVGSITAGSNLKFYKDNIAATATKPASAAILPTIALAPTKPSLTVGNYYVTSTVDGVESERTLVAITIAALPTEVASVITGVGPVVSAVGVTPVVNASAVKLDNYAGTSTVFTYSVASAADAGLTYVWSVPNGANLLSGQGTNTITVNYLNVTPGVGAVGNIAVQLVNSNGCGSAVKTLAITKALPVAPKALVVIDTNIPVAEGKLPVPVKSVEKYLGTTAQLKLSATAAATANSYVWELPAGVNQVSGGTSNEIVVNFAGVSASEAATLTLGVKSKNNIGVSTAKTVVLTAAASDAPAKLALVDATTGVAVKTLSTYIGTETELLLQATGAKTAATYNWILPSGVTKVVSGANGAFIRVKFAGVAAGVTSLEIGVKGVNAIGESAATTKLVLAASAPAAATLVVTDPADLTVPAKAITDVTKYIGTSTVLKATAASLLANTYGWTLPAGANQISGGTTGVITFDLADVDSGVTSLPLSVVANNGVGSAAAKVVSLIAKLPAPVAAVAGQVAGICAGSTVTYTIAASPLATAYAITAPAGSVVTSASNTTNTTASLTTSDLVFSVTYPSAFVATAVAPNVKTLSVTAVNAVGVAAAKTVALLNALPALGTVTGATPFSTSATSTITLAAVPGASTYVWAVANGAEIVSGQGTNSIVVSFAGVSVASTKITVLAQTSCGVSSAVKTITLTKGAARVAAAPIASDVAVYPNTTSGDFNINVTASRADSIQLSIYSFEGALVSSPRNVKLQEGFNTINENISSLKKGIYIVRIVNANTNEVIVKKVIKK